RPRPGRIPPRGGPGVITCAGSRRVGGAESRPSPWSCRGWSGSGRVPCWRPRRPPRTARKSRPGGTTGACRDGAPWPPGTAGSWGWTWRYGLTLLAVAEDLVHQDRVAALGVVDFRHVVAHQHQAAAAGSLQVLDGGRVGHVERVEAGAFVGDANLEAVAMN